VYQILADLNLAYKNIKEQKAKLEEKECEINLLKENLVAVSDNKELEKIKSRLSQQITEYALAIEHLNKKVDYLIKENSNANQILKLKDQKIQESEKTLEEKDDKINKAEENLKINLLSFEEHVKNSRKLNDGLKELEDFKISLISELEEKNHIIYTLQQENLSFKKENNQLSEFKKQAALYLNGNLDSKLNEDESNLLNGNNNNKDSAEPISPSRPRFDYNTPRKPSYENFGLAENLKDNLQTSYNKSLKKIDALKRENEKFCVQLSALKDIHKIEVMQLNLTIEELLKITNNATTNNYNSYESETGKVSSIVKAIHSKINEKTIEEFKKDKINYLETIEKLKQQIEALETANNMDNISIHYQQTETFVHNFTHEKAIESSNNLNIEIKNKEDKIFNINNTNNINDKNKNNNYIDNNSNQNQNISILENDIININDFMEKNQNEIRERERKIEYLLQILEEKNNLIEQLRDFDKITSPNHSTEAKDNLEFLQFQNENLLKEIEEKNAKIKKLNKNYNDQLAKYELLQADFSELHEKENEIIIYTDEIELFKNKNKEYESIIEKMSKDLNVKSYNLIRKEKEVNSLKADRANNITNKSLLDNTNNKSILMDNNPNNITNGSIIKDPKIEHLNNSLNEIRDLKEKLKHNNRSMRSRRGNSDYSVLNNNSLLNSNNSIILNVTNENMPRVFFEEDPNASYKKKVNNINNSLNSLGNSFAVDTTNFNIGNISKINLNDVNPNNKENENGSNEAANKVKNQISVNKQALFVSEFASNINDNNPYFTIGSDYTTNNGLNNLATYENYYTDPNLNNNNTNNNFCSNATETDNNNFISKELLNPNYHSVPENSTLSINALNSNINTSSSTAKKDFANLNIRVFESIQPQDILQSQENWDQIRNWVANSLQKEKNKFFFHKIFKATENSFNSASFYIKAEAKSPTLIILRNNFGKIIGGFTSIAWKTPVNSIDFLEDPSKSGFLFSVSLGKKYELKENAIAVCHSFGCGPVFGLNDLEIVENAYKNHNYFSNIGTSYNFDDKMEDFYGAAKFLVEDYEAYEVIFV
jgi:hypothetical protein